MADFPSRNINTEFSGLATSVAIFGGVGGAALLAFETLRQMRRTPKTFIPPFWKADRWRATGGPGGVYGEVLDKQAQDGEIPLNNVVGARNHHTCEDWEMGHLYLARMFHAKTPSPPMSRWPLGWAWQAIRLNDWWYATHTGMDTVVYVRFLKIAFYWMLLQTLTTAPILLAIHLYYAKISESGTGQLTDMSQASLSYLVTLTECPCNSTNPALYGPCIDGFTRVNTTLRGGDCRHVPNERGRRLLWVHLVLMWFITFSWFFALYWIGRGSLRIRRQWVEEVRRRRQAEETTTLHNSHLEKDASRHGDEAQDRHSSSDETARDASSERAVAPATQEHSTMQPSAILARSHALEESDGWRQRTLLVSNLPPNMRDEASIRRYFEEFLRPDDEGETFDAPGHGLREGSSGTEGGFEKRGTTSDTTSPNTKIRSALSPYDEKLRSPVQTVVLVRKMNELSSMLTRRQEVLSQLEAAHIKLAQNVLVEVRKHARSMRGDETPPDEKKLEQELAKKTPAQLMKQLKRKLKGEPMTATEQLNRKKGMNQLLEHLGRFVSRDRYDMNTRHQFDEKDMPQTVWEALNELPRELLDPFQPVTRLSSLFRGQKVPTIDYLLTKLNLLTALVTEMRARPPSSYEATSTAFVTFRDPRQARMVWRELKSQIVVKVRLAPEVKDLDWERLMRTSFTGDIVRSFGVSSFFWFFTIIWVVPVNLLATSLFSVEKLKKPFPVLANFLEDHQQLESFISVTLPTLIVSLLTMAVPEVIFQISKRAQGFVTFSALYDQCLCRYWKFVICNVVIFFCIGSTTVESVIFQLGATNTNNSLLNGVAFNFPTAAPFYVSYMILGMALHTGFELVGFMIPLLQHFGARKAATPRIRALKTLPRNFNRYYWLPFHVLILSIVFLFALLNPLVIPFALVYVFVAMTVFKKNLAYQYYRRFNEKEGVVYFIRLSRYSLDGLMVAQVVILVFFSVTRQESAYIGLTAVLIPITTGFKLLSTRLWKSQCRAVEDDEANALCGIANFSASVESVAKMTDPERGIMARHGGMPEDARAHGRYPTLLETPKSSSRVVNAWNKIHNSFNANGHDSPSYFADASARGNNVNALTVTQAVASVPKDKIKHRAGRGLKYAKAGVGMHRSAPAGSFNVRESLALSSFPQKDEQEEKGDKGEHDPLEHATARDLRQFLDGPAESQLGSTKTGDTVQRRLSRRHNGPDAPFLSGFETLTSHAPIIEDEDDGIAGLKDGEYEELLSMSRRNEYEEQKRKAHRRRRTSGSEGTAGGAPSGQTPSKDQEKHSSARKGEQDSDEEGPLVRPHASISWDDTPNNHAKYNNPFYSVELDPFLWFPRDPLMIIDLCDTIEWHGPALVSSQGGSGRVGEWEDDLEDEEPEEAEAGGHEGDASMAEVSSVVSRSKSPSFTGAERIAMSGSLAQRMEEAEELEELADPSESMSRQELNEYRRALDDQDDTIAEEDEDAVSLSQVEAGNRLSVPRRRDSMLSRNSSFMSRSGSRRRLSNSSSGRMDIFRHSMRASQSSMHRSEDAAAEASNNASAGRASLLVPGSQDVQMTRVPSRASMSMRSVVSTDVQRKPTTKATGPPVAMKKALRAEVLQEEMIRTMKENVKRRRQNASEGSSYGLRRQASQMRGDVDPAAKRMSAGPADLKASGSIASKDGGESRSPKSPAAARFSAIVRAAHAQQKSEDAELARSGNRNSLLSVTGVSEGASLSSAVPAAGASTSNEAALPTQPSVSAAPAASESHTIKADDKGKTPAP